MKIVHWTLKNESGLHRMAEELSAHEKSTGQNSLCLDGDNPAEIPQGLDADIHVIHGHLPDAADTPGARTVFVAHGTPENGFISSINDSAGGHGAPDAFMSALYRLQTSDAVVTFWPRHQAILESMMDKGRTVACIPMGIDLAKWQRRPSRGKWAGAPSLLSAENCHPIKWPLDLFIAMAWAMQRIRTLRLHCFHVPLDQQRWWSALTFRNGTAYRSFMAASTLNPEGLVNAFGSVDYYIGLVRYGDFNRIGLEAAAAGCPVIAYRGNDFADYWIDEGDQRVIAEQLVMILQGDIPKREIRAVPDISETAEAMAAIYERLI